MRKFAIISASALSLALGACSTTQTANINAEISQVQQAAVAACSFLPTTATVAAILSALVPGAAPIEQIAATTASQICSAVSNVKLSGRLGGAVAQPMVNGVPVHGRFVQS